MKVFIPARLQRPGLWFSLLLMCLLPGCATQKIDWAGRVGNYTFDQAVMEFGPPDKQAKLQDGTSVAEWVTQRGYMQNRGSLGYGLGYPCYYGPFYPTWTDTYRSPDYFLRLIFAPDGRLKEWKKFNR
jgi:hypothetical protein